MRRHRFNADVFTPARVRIGASVGAVVVCAALIGATAAPAATQQPPQPDRAPHGLLQIRFSTPEPLVSPPPLMAGGQMAVLADPPANLATDPDLQSSRDLATIRQADAVMAHDAEVQATLWAREDARMQAQIDTAMRPYSGATAPTFVANLQRSGDPEITASAGDTRKVSSPAD